LALVDDAKAACVDAFFNACTCGVGLSDNAAHAAIEKVLSLTVVDAVNTSNNHWKRPAMRHFFLRHARLMARVACGYAAAEGRSILSDKNIMDAADQVVWRAQGACGGPGPGCQAYVAQRPVNL
jgi:hypothetical protein